MISPVQAMLIEHINQQSEAIDAWFEKAYGTVRPCFYSSVDIRHSGFKIAPVDTNLFPAGFNNLSQEARQKAVIHVEQFFERYFPEVESVLLIPESHTRNLKYLDNIVALKHILEQAGKDVYLGWLNQEHIDEFHLTSASGEDLTIERIKRTNQHVMLENGFIPDMVIINNDLTEGAPSLLENITQPILPPITRGWFQRRKTAHFEAYNHIASQFAKEFNFDPWLISTLFQQCGKVDFKTKQGIECVAIAVEKLLHQIRSKYKENNIQEEPYVFIKADRGTYGMGIMAVRSADEIAEMNKKARNKMHVVKSGIQNTEVIIQEGVPTIDKVDNYSAEPLIYLVGGKPVGCMYRINKERDSYANLNASGMEFNPITPTENIEQNPCPVQGLIARLASLAAISEDNV